MKGTEKQIAWAQKIKSKYTSDIFAAKQLLHIAIEKSTDGSENNMIFKETLSKIEAIEAIDDAAWWIDNGKMNHDNFKSYSPLYKLSNARVLADPKARLIATIRAVK